MCERRRKGNEKMVLSAAAGKTEISYLFSWCSRIPFHCRQYAGGFFRYWEDLEIILKSEFQKSCLLDGYGRRKRKRLIGLIQEQTKETRQEWEKSAKHTELMLEELPYKYKRSERTVCKNLDLHTFMKIMTDFAGN